VPNQGLGTPRCCTGLPWVLNIMQCTESLLYLRRGNTVLFYMESIQKTVDWCLNGGFFVASSGYFNNHFLSMIIVVKRSAKRVSYYHSSVPCICLVYFIAVPESQVSWSQCLAHGKVHSTSHKHSECLSEWDKEIKIKLVNITPYKIYNFY
jgi:hypothetical protein